jgi:hypothetical protein
VDGDHDQRAGRRCGREGDEPEAAITRGQEVGADGREDEREEGDDQAGPDFRRDVEAGGRGGGRHEEPVHPADGPQQREGAEADVGERGASHAPTRALPQPPAHSPADGRDPGRSDGDEGDDAPSPPT